LKKSQHHGFPLYDRARWAAIYNSASALDISTYDATGSHSTTATTTATTITTSSFPTSEVTRLYV
jgi:hypothetical protein